MENNAPTEQEIKELILRVTNSKVNSDSDVINNDRILDENISKINRLYRESPVNYSNIKNKTSELESLLSDQRDTTLYKEKLEETKYKPITDALKIILPRILLILIIILIFIYWIYISSKVTKLDYEHLLDVNQHLLN
jgi:hypothetical protein